MVPATSGMIRTPNHVLPSHRRCRASVRIGSLPWDSVTGSIVVTTHLSQSSANLNGTPPMMRLRQSSSENGAMSPSTTTLGLNLLMSIGWSPWSSAIHRSSCSSDADVVSSRGPVSARLSGSSPRPPWLSAIVRLLGSSCQARRTGSSSSRLNHAAAPSPASTIVGSRLKSTVSRAPPVGTGTWVEGWEVDESVRPPLSSGVATTLSRTSCVVALSRRPSGVTTAQRRSCRRPASSTTAFATGTTAVALTGCNRIEPTFTRAPSRSTATMACRRTARRSG